MTPNEIISIAIASVALSFALLARQDSKKSAAEAKRANELACLPLLEWRSQGRLGDNDVCFDFKNRGATVVEPKITVESRLDGTIEPNTTIASDGRGRVIFRWPIQQKRPDSFKFSIRFVNKLNEMRKLDFAVSSNSSGSLELPKPA
jgi:hypothetical protein